MVNFDSDTEILNHTRREGEKDYTKFIFPANLLPFDDPVVAHIDKVEAASVAEWCSLVRSKVRAWEKSQNPEERSTEATREAASAGEAPEVRDSGGGEATVQRAVQANEDEMEKFILQSIGACEAEIETLERERDAIEERLEFLYVQFHKATQAHIAYVTGGKSAASDDEKRPSTS